MPQIPYRHHRRAAACAIVAAVAIGIPGCGSSSDADPGAATTIPSDPPQNTETEGLVRPVDFAPFDEALGELDAARLEELDRIVLSSTVTELRAMVDAGDVSARELTLVYVSRIRDFDGSLHAVGELNPDALAEAERVDALIESGEPAGRLAGMPILLKDNIATGDRLHNTAGAAALADHVAPRDSFVVEQLRSEGAVILGKTNLSEWAFFMSSKAPSGYSALGGQVVNPYGADLEVFGSSTGSAVAASSAFAAATLGTETTGSIVAPSAANGVAGMRPTYGLVSGDLIIPITASLDSAGPIAADVRSLAELLTVMSVADPDDANVALAEGLHGTDFTKGLDAASLDGLKVGVPDSAMPAEGDPSRPLLDAAIAALEEAGATVETVPVDAEGLQTLGAGQVELLSGSMRADVDRYLAEAEAPVGSLAEIVSFNEADPEARAPFGQDFLIASRDSAVTPEQHAEMAGELRKVAGDLIASAAADADVDVLLSLDNTFSLAYAIAGTPAVTVPAGADAAGQPHGATFVGISPGTDANVLDVAYAFEQATELRTAPAL